MSKNLIIVILALVSLLSLTYGYTQKQRADEQEAIAIENAKMAREQKVLAEQAAQEAEMQKMVAKEYGRRAMEQMALAEAALKDVKRKK